jgi:hypothetical protein
MGHAHRVALFVAAVFRPGAVRFGQRVAPTSGPSLCGTGVLLGAWQHFFLVKSQRVVYEFAVLGSTTVFPSVGGPILPGVTPTGSRLRSICDRSPCRLPAYQGVDPERLALFRNGRNIDDCISARSNEAISTVGATPRRRRWSTGIPSCPPHGRPSPCRRRTRVCRARRERGQFECHFVTATPEIGRHELWAVLPVGDDQKELALREHKAV